MKKALSLFIALICLPAFAANQADIEALKRNVIENIDYTRHISPEMTRIVLGSRPDAQGNLPVFTFEMPDGKLAAYSYLGTETLNGRETALFEFEGKYTPEQFEQMRRAGKFPNLPGNATPGEDYAGSQAPGAQTSGASLGNALGDIFASGAGAGAQSAIATGIIRGVLITPGDQREFDRLKGELQAGEARVLEQRNRLFGEIADYDLKLGKMAQDFLHRADSFQPLSARPLKPEQASAFARSHTGQKVQKVRADLHNFNPATPTQKGLKDFGLATADAAEESFGESDVLHAEELANVAEAVAGVALGINPVTSLVQDGFEMFTGRNFVTGRELTSFERTLASAGFVAGLATGGLGSSVVNATEIAGKILVRQSGAVKPLLVEMANLATHLRGLGVQTAQGWNDFVGFTRRTLGNEIGAVGNVNQLIELQKVHLGSWANRYQLYRVHDANVLNAQILAKNPRYLPPYHTGSTAYDLITKQKEHFVRLHSGKNMEGRWLQRIETIDKNLSPAELRVKYSLPQVPDAIVHVEVDANVLLRRSKVRTNFGGNGGATQYEVLDPLNSGKIKFSGSTPLSEYFGR